MKKIFLKRVIGSEILSAANEFPVIILTGPRQTGKSTLLKMLFPSYTYITMDDPFARKTAVEDPILFLEKGGEKMLIDEVQYIPGILPYIKILVDKNRDQNGRFILTGSQIFPLMQGVSESLAGRAAIYELLEFSYEEIHEVVKINTTADFFEMILRGFFPDPAVQGVRLHNFFRSYLQSYIERDIRQVRSVQDLHTFQVFLELLATRSGSILNLNEVAKDCGISHTTARNWLSLMETTRIIYLLRPYFKNIGKRVIKSPKLYFTDTGFLAFLLKYPDAGTLQAGPAAGAIFENFIIMEVLKYKLNHNLLYDLYFYRDSNHNEVDLVLDYGLHQDLFEIKSSRTLKTEFFSTLERISHLFPQSERFLVSLSSEATFYKNSKGIPWHDLPRVITGAFNRSLPGTGL